MEPGPELGPVVAVLGAMVGYTPQDGSAWLSQLVKENRESEILELVQREYPEIKIMGLAVIGSPSSVVRIANMCSNGDRSIAPLTAQ